jgi:hypothetical protein
MQRKVEGFAAVVKQHVCRGSMRRIAARAGQIASTRFYLRAAQAYMLISMPTGTSTIFGVFQVIRVSQAVWRDVAPQGT